MNSLDRITAPQTDYEFRRLWPQAPGNPMLIEKAGIAPRLRAGIAGSLLQTKHKVDC